MGMNGSLYFVHAEESVSVIAAAHWAGASAFTNSSWIDTCRFTAMDWRADLISFMTASRRARFVSRMSAVRLTRLGMLFTASGKTSLMPTVATVYTAPLHR